MAALHPAAPVNSRKVQPLSRSGCCNDAHLQAEQAVGRWARGLTCNNIDMGTAVKRSAAPTNLGKHPSLEAAAFSRVSGQATFVLLQPQRDSTMAAAVAHLFEGTWRLQERGNCSNCLPCNVIVAVGVESGWPDNAAGQKYRLLSIDASALGVHQKVGSKKGRGVLHRTQDLCCNGQHECTSGCLMDLATGSCSSAALCCCNSRQTESARSSIVQLIPGPLSTSSTKTDRRYNGAHMNKLWHLAPYQSPRTPNHLPPLHYLLASSASIHSPRRSHAIDVTHSSTNPGTRSLQEQVRGSVWFTESPDVLVCRIASAHSLATSRARSP